MGTITHHIYLMCKRIYINCKTIAFERLADCVRERKRYQQINKNDTKHHPKEIHKSMKTSVELLDKRIKTKQPMERLMVEQTLHSDGRGGDLPVNDPYK